MDEYLKDPKEIEEKSFGLIRELTDLTSFDADQQQIVMRLVHTCGNPEIASRVRISDGVVEQGLRALTDKAPVLCDVEMVRQGLTSRFLESEPLCFLNHAGVDDTARASRVSRSMTAVELWRPHLPGGIAIVGNAPTALYRLMELIEEGAGRPSLVIGMPVGFVGAGESKQYLWDNRRELEVECITIEGRTGGSALAAAAFNTLVRLHRGLRF